MNVCMHVVPRIPIKNSDRKLFFSYINCLTYHENGSAFRQIEKAKRSGCKRKSGFYLLIHRETIKISLRHLLDFMQVYFINTHLYMRQNNAVHNDRISLHACIHNKKDRPNLILQCGGNNTTLSEMYSLNK